MISGDEKLDLIMNECDHDISLIKDTNEVISTGVIRDKPMYLPSVLTFSISPAKPANTSSFIGGSHMFSELFVRHSTILSMLLMCTFACGNVQQ